MNLQLSDTMKELLLSHEKEDARLKSFLEVILTFVVLENKELFPESIKYIDDSYNDKNLEELIESVIFSTLGNKVKLSDQLPIETLSINFRNKFKDRNIERWGTLSTCKERLKKYLKNNPDVTGEEIIKATEMYLNNTDPNYIMKSHKFIYDGIGSSLNSTLEEWIEKYREVSRIQEKTLENGDKTEIIQ